MDGNPNETEVSMTTTVDTARGPVATADLGPTLMHEHIVTRSPGVQENGPSPGSAATRPASTAAEARATDSRARSRRMASKRPWRSGERKRKIAE